MINLRSKVILIMWTDRLHSIRTHVMEIHLKFCIRMQEISAVSL